MVQLIKNLYVKLIRPFFKDELDQQRFKLIYFIWGYIPIFKVKELAYKQKFDLFRKFLKVDWYVLHGHRPAEISEVVKVLCKRKAKPGEIMIEAGCFNGGSTIKFSHLCKLQGLSLHIFDSFEGVEPLSEELKAVEFDFSGAYAASEELVWDNLKKYGEPDVCKTFKGWFCDSMNPRNIKEPVSLVFIDCDLAKGTGEVLDGIVPNLVEDGVIFSQDYHITSVRHFLNETATWKKFGKGIPEVKKLCWNLASIKF